MNRNSFKLLALCILVNVFPISLPSYAEVITLLEENAPKHVLVPDTTVKNVWRVNGPFTDTKWTDATGGVGYEKGTGYEQWIQTSVESKMYHENGSPNRSCYIRIKFNVTADQISRARRMRLLLRYDDGVVIYINAYEAFKNNAPDKPDFKSLATGEHEAGADPEEINISSFIQYLQTGENLLAIQGFNISPNDSDFLITAKITLDLQGNPPVFESTNLPLVVINTNVGIPYHVRVPADMGIVDNGPGQRNHITDPFNGYNGKISIEVRGSSSASFDKVSFNFETQDSLGNNRNVSLLGLSKENDWILYGPYIDKSLMRDVLMYHLSNSIGRYASHSRFCEVSLNGWYYGIFAILEKIKQDKNRVDVSKLDADDIQGDSLTGGYIIKLDRSSNPTERYYLSPYPPYPGGPILIRYLFLYPKDEDLKDEQRQYITGFISSFEDVMNGTGYADPENGYSKFIDEDSFVDYFLLNELAKNADSYRLSTILYKNRDSKEGKPGKLHAGPIWDMNLACGNDFWYGCDSPEGWIVEELSLGTAIRQDNAFPPFWWIKIFKDPRFAQRVINRWQALRTGAFESSKVNAVIDSIANILQEAQVRNFQAFSGPGDAGKGFWPVPDIFYTFSTYKDEVDYLKYWLNERMKWMDNNVPKLTGVSGNSDNLPKSFVLQQNYPNPFNPSTNISYQLSELCHVELKVFDMLGREIITLADKEQDAGKYNIKFDGSSLSSGIYFCRINTSGKTKFVKTIKLALTK